MIFTVGQETAIREIWALCSSSDPEDKYLIIEGPAGVGKSEIIREIVMNFESRMKAIRKLTGDNNLVSNIRVTTTTNKAIEALQSKGIEEHIPDKQFITTINSAIGVKTVNGKLVSTRKSPLQYCLVLIDECSFIGDELLEYIDVLTDDNCKVVFIGDPYQLPPVRHPTSPVFEQGLPTVVVDQIMRNTGSIQALSLALREFVKGGEMPELVPDNQQLFLIDNEDEFVDLWLNTISSGESTKLIGYENSLVHNANSIAKAELEDSTSIQVGDTLINNHYVPHPIRQIKTDATVFVTGLANKKSLGYMGKHVTLGMGISVFVPNDPKAFGDIKANIGKLSSQDKRTYERGWADLRPAYACTIHKSQGSTYRNVFINLDELRTIKDDNSLSRLLYVAVSRASHKVYFTGTL